MMHPESKGSVVTDQMVRPSIADWTRDIPRDVSSFNHHINKLLDKVLRCGDQAQTLLALFRHQARHVEPVDRVLGKDPMLRKSSAFFDGTAIGLMMAVPLIMERPETLNFAITHTQVLVRKEVMSIEHEDELEQADMRARYLMEKGGQGRALFDEAEDALDDLVDGIEADITQQLYTKTGAGVMLGVIWEGYKRAEEMEMMRLGGLMLSGCEEDMDLALASFLAEEEH